MQQWGACVPCVSLVGHEARDEQNSGERRAANAVLGEQILREAVAHGLKLDGHPHLEHDAANEEGDEGGARDESDKVVREPRERRRLHPY